MQILAKAHVEHFVGFVEHHGFDSCQFERAALEMVAQPPGRADNDMHAVCELAAFAAGIHAADAGDDARAGILVEPVQFALHLHRQFARRRDDQRQRLAGGPEGVGAVQQWFPQSPGRRRWSCRSPSAPRPEDRGRRHAAFEHRAWTGVASV